MFVGFHFGTKLRSDYNCARISSCFLLQVITHPGWKLNQTSVLNDYQILKLDRTVPESSTVKYAKLPARQGRDRVRAGDPCYVVGWGSTDNYTGPASDVLQKGAMRMITNKDCRARGGGSPGFDTIGPMHICAKSAHVSTSACTGDSGGPLFCRPRRNRRRMIQVGVTSFVAIPCGTKGKPVAFARVSNVLDWIKSHF